MTSPDAVCAPSDIPEPTPSSNIDAIGANMLSTGRGTRRTEYGRPDTFSKTRTTCLVLSVSGPPSGNSTLATRSSSIALHTCAATSETVIQLSGAVPGPKIIARPATWSQPIFGENQTSMNALGCTMVQ